MRPFLCLAAHLSLLFTIPCFCQDEVNQYLNFQEVAKKYKTYTFTIDDSAIAKFLPAKQLQKVFRESFSFLNKKKSISIGLSETLHVHVIFKEPEVYLPTTQLIYQPSYANGLKKYNVITKYSMSVLLGIQTVDSIIYIPLCTNKYFNKEKEVLIADLNSPAGSTGSEPFNLQETLSLQRKKYEPGAQDFKDNLLTVLDHYRRKVNVN